MLFSYIYSLVVCLHKFIIPEMVLIDAPVFLTSQFPTQCKKYAKAVVIPNLFVK